MKLLRLLLVPFALLEVVAIRLIAPWRKIRIGQLFSDRIGHLSGNAEVYLCERDAGMHPCTDIWFHSAKPCNAQLAKMLARVITIDRTGFARVVYILLKLMRGTQAFDPAQGSLDRDPMNLLEKYPPHLTFTAREEAQGEEGLRAMGIPAGAKWVCLIVRDASYLPELAYHSYRDSDIATYAPAVQALAERGYYVVRMGAAVGKPLPVMHPRVIDYAANGMRSEFMDVYLGARCEFCISNSTGFDSICEVFRRPICFVNFVPLEYLRTYIPNSLAIWKHHFKDGKRMTLAEIYESKSGHFMRAEEYAEAGITLVDNTAQEITEAVLEMDGVRRDRVWDADPNAEFWRAFPRSVSTYTGRPLHGEIRMRIGREFLRGYA